MGHREGIREYLKDIEVSGIIFDFGAGTKPIKNYLKPSNAKFLAIDKLTHVRADLVTDIEAEGIDLPEQADFAFALEVIEHTWDVHNVVRNIYNNLKSGGLLFLSQPYMYPTHKSDDVRRFTHHGLRRLLESEGFIVEDISSTGGKIEEALGFVVRARKAGDTNDN